MLIIESIEDDAPPACPHCTNADLTLIEHKGNEWFCVVCTRTWRKMCGKSDQLFLKSLHVSPPKA